MWRSRCQRPNGLTALVTPRIRAPGETAVNPDKEKCEAYQCSTNPADVPASKIGVTPEDFYNLRQWVEIIKEGEVCMKNTRLFTLLSGNTTSEFALLPEDDALYETDVAGTLKKNSSALNTYFEDKNFSVLRVMPLQDMQFIDSFFVHAIIKQSGKHVIVVFQRCKWVDRLIKDCRCYKVNRCKARIWFKIYDNEKDVWEDVLQCD
jgi:hypothetical protein